MSVSGFRRPQQTTSPEAPLSTKERIPELDGFRGIAILLVVIYHFTDSNRFEIPLLALTWSGVDMFFVLSGFLICGILLDARESPQYFSTFYARRAFRILPVYGILLLCVFALPVRDTTPRWIYFIFAQNIWLSGHNSGFGYPFLGPTWSLAVEEHFYFVLPLVIFLLPRRLVALTLASCIAIAPIWRYAVWPGMGATVFTAARADTLAWGALLGLGIRTESVRRLISRSGNLMVAAAVSIAFLGWESTQYAPAHTPWLSSALALCYTCLLAAALFLRPAVLRGRALIWAGKVAYSTYLVHQGIWLIVRTRPISYGAQILLALTILVPIVSASWLLFERHLIHFASRRFVY